MARSAKDAIEVVEKLFDNGVRVHILNIGIVEDTPTGRLIFNIMSAFAQFERDMIVERTQEGKAIAKQKPDFREGRPKKFSKKQIDHALNLLKNHSYKQVGELTGISKADLPYIFERLYTGEASRNHHLQGNGLGLSITRKLVEKLKGEIFVESIPYKETKFSFYLLRFFDSDSFN